MHKSGHIVILHGNLAPEGAVAKIAGLKQVKHDRPGQGFRRRGSLFRRHPGPKDSSRATSWSFAAKARSAGRECARCFRSPARWSARDLASSIGLITDGRFSGGTHGLVVGHVAAGSLGRRPHRPGQRRRPRHHRRRPKDCAGGGPRDEWKKRKAGWVKPALRSRTRGACQICADRESASEGAVTG